MKVVVFTDGACTSNGKKGARAAWAAWFPDHTELSDAQVVPADQNQTNQRGELMGISQSIQIIEKNFSYETDIHIYTDSKYSKDCLTTWLPAWLSNNWKTKQGKDVCHRDLIEDTSSRLAKFNSFTITHVEAHTGGDDYCSKNNAQADKLATRVLNPDDEARVISTNKEVAIDGLPLALLGPPVSDSVIHTWCRENLHKLDQTELNNALATALSKTLKKKGFELIKQRLHRSAMYRLVTTNHLITEGTTIVKEE